MYSFRPTFYEKKTKLFDETMGNTEPRDSLLMLFNCRKMIKTLVAMRHMKESMTNEDKQMMAVDDYPML